MSLGPLGLPGWLEFNCLKWGVKAERVCSSSKDSEPAVEAIIYRDAKGQVCLPPLNPYMPVHFRTTPGAAPYRLYRQWLDVTGELVTELSRAGISGLLAFPPDIRDVRPWQWNGLTIGVKYTFHLEFPYDVTSADHAIRKNINKAARAGYTSARATDLAEVCTCLAETESRQGFAHRLTPDDLKRAEELMGNDHFRVYMCWAPSGEPASARVVLHQPGSRAVDWVAGTKTAHLTSGATQNLIQFVLDDLQKARATGFDFGGANIPNVAAAKANWGGQLVPFYTFEQTSWRTVVRLVRHLLGKGRNGGGR